MSTWISPDNKIHKEILRSGKWGRKPSEGSRCRITIKDCPSLEGYVNSPIIIGDNDGDLWRGIDICLTTMFAEEESKFSITLSNGTTTVTLELLDFEFNGFIYELDASKKYNLALHHKAKGIELFHAKNNKDAAFRFTKALKMLLTIPIDVENPPEVIDGVKLSEINNLKGNLYNNLCSCYFRNQIWNMVIDLGKKVLRFDGQNVKALYKMGVAYEEDRDYEKAGEAFSKVLEIEPENKACSERLAHVKSQLKKSEIKVNNMVKKMFGAVVEPS